MGRGELEGGERVGRGDEIEECGAIVRGEGGEDETAEERGCGVGFPEGGGGGETLRGGEGAGFEDAVRERACGRGRRGSGCGG